MHGRALGQAQTTQRAVHAAAVHLGPCGAGRPFVRALTHSLHQPGLTRTPVPPVAQHGAVQPICPYMLPTCTPLDGRRVALHLFPESAVCAERLRTLTHRHSHKTWWVGFEGRYGWHGRTQVNAGTRAWAYVATIRQASLLVVGVHALELHVSASTTVYLYICFGLTAEFPPQKSEPLICRKGNTMVHAKDTMQPDCVGVSCPSHTTSHSDSVY